MKVDDAYHLVRRYANQAALHYAINPSKANEAHIDRMGDHLVIQIRRFNETNLLALLDMPSA
ncbi:MAG: hypothetical protein KGH64_04265 [Candidatus Micrarchaeota archaeon]|nr:hypothetical protein [Candidatus Micrarchaeota archaeon]